MNEMNATFAGSVEQELAATPRATLGGLPIAVVTRSQAAAMIIRAAEPSETRTRPFYFTSANGEVIARAALDRNFGALLREADQIVADGQPLVFASRRLCRETLPERVATTDLFHDVARLAEVTGSSFYLFGATEAENDKAVAAVRAAYPHLRIVGHCHGFLHGEDLDRKIEEINALAPNVLWVALGVPREQEFVQRYAARLNRVGVLKTSGGLFDFLSGKNRRAPEWMQRAGLEWLWRACLEPRRLGLRYSTTSPVAIFAMLTNSR